MAADCVSHVDFASDACYITAASDLDETAEVCGGIITWLNSWF